MKVIFTNFNHTLGKFQIPVKLLYKKKNKYFGYVIQCEFPNGNRVLIPYTAVEKFTIKTLNLREIKTEKY